VPAWRKIGQPCILRITGGRNVTFLYVLREIVENGLNQPDNKIFSLFNGQGQSSFHTKNYKIRHSIV